MDTTKEAGLREMATSPIAAQLAAAILGTGLMAADSAHVARLEEEAELMNQALRAHEAEKMRQTTGMLDAKYASAEAHAGRAIKIAAAMTIAGGDREKLAYLLEQQGMDKEAIGALLGGLARGAGAALRGLGGAASAAGRLKVPPSAPQQFRQAWQGAQSAAPAAPGALQRAGGWLQGKGQQLGAAGAKPAAAAAPVAASAAPAAAQTAAKSKPLLSMATKGKLVAGGALAGAGYLGMKGLQGARDYMMQPAGHTRAPIMNDVNQYGYPQY